MISRGSGSAWCAGEAVGLLPARTQHLAQALTPDPKGWAQNSVRPVAADISKDKMSFKEATLPIEFRCCGMRSHEGASECALRALPLPSARDHKGQGSAFSTAELLTQQLSLRKRQ